MTRAYVREDVDLAYTGQWAVIRGIRRPTGPRPPDTPETPTIDRTEGGTIACPICRCKPHQACRTPTGNTIRPHADRIIPRQCKCGGEVTPRSTTCHKCQERNRVEYETRRTKARKQTRHARRQDTAA